MSDKNIEKVWKRVEKLKKEINRHDRLYYVENSPEISDFEYDKLYNELLEIERKYPMMKTPNSPTQRVGGEPIKEFVTVKHDIPMMSLGNTYSEDELREFDKRVKKNIGNDFDYVVEPKIDGVSVSIKYRDGLFYQALSRGNGYQGDDITTNVKTIKSIPLTLKDKVNIEVRGEVFLPRSIFEKLNKKLKKPFANPRNATAGTLKTLNPKVVAERELSNFMYNIANKSDIHVDTHYNALEYLTHLGFKVNKHYVKCQTIEDVISHINKWKEVKDSLDYDVDGLVIKVNSFNLQDELGFTQKEPRWAIAFKYPPTQAFTTLEHVELQIGRLGTITPVAKLKPVFLDGTTVSSASLHNFDEIVKNDIRIKDTVIIEKSGEIIPQVVGVVTNKRPEDSKPIVIPDECPVCHSKVEKVEDEVALRCSNKECPAVVERQIEYFSSKTAMDIEGLGTNIVKLLIKNNLVKSIADLYFLKKDDLLSLEGFKDKRVENLLSSIEKSKNAPFPNLLCGLGIRYVGKKVAGILSRQFQSIEKLKSLTVDELTVVNEIGDRVAESIVNYFNDDKNLELLRRLDEAGVRMEVEKDKQYEILDNTPLSGKKIVLTGNLTNYTRQEAEDIITKLGGMTTSSVSKKTDAVIYGEKAGSKLDKAKEYGINTINESVFEDIINTHLNN